jgi:hypothetical protein
MWAAPLTTQRPAADSRFLRGVRLLLADGQLERFAEVVPVIEACDPGPLRDLVLGSFAYETGDAEGAQRLLSRAAAEEDADPSVRADAHIRLSSIYIMRGEPVRQAQSAEAALSLGGGDDQITRSALGSLASAEFSLNGAPAGLAVLEKRLPERPGDVAGADGELLAVRGLLRLYAAQTRSGIVVCARRSGCPGRASHSSIYLPRMSIWPGRSTSSATGMRRWCTHELPRRSSATTGSAGSVGVRSR